MSQPSKPKDLARLIDHTLLRADASLHDIEKLCAEARQQGFFSVCVNGSRVAQACALLEETEVKVCTVVGFPLGASDCDAKRYETEVAIDNGAAEIDVVINIGKLKDGDDNFILRELRDVVEAADERLVKVIIETALLSNDDKIRACHLIAESGAKFVKTSTGFGPHGATVEDVRLLREAVGALFGVKASGGIRDTTMALAMVAAGATRLGTSASVAIVQGLPTDAGPSSY
ncbi:MAG: deoxyribose-phosphate aldolase [Pedosphaera sp.]|nr:deoxyribose-phosphate aldolase [Pedosphaera sp.]